MMVFSKLDGNNKEAMLAITGRDVDSKELFLKFNNDKFKWELASEASDYQTYKDQLEYKNNPIVITIKALLDEDEYKEKGLRIKASELLERIIDLTGIQPRQKSPQVLSREINENLRFQLWNFDKIYYEAGNGKRWQIW